MMDLNWPAEEAGRDLEVRGVCLKMGYNLDDKQLQAKIEFGSERLRDQDTPSNSSLFSMRFAILKLCALITAIAN